MSEFRFLEGEFYIFNGKLSISLFKDDIFKSKIIPKHIKVELT